jgi:cyclopropane fatty-acyl-phospholipid synthase-like methyltransferase
VADYVASVLYRLADTFRGLLRIKSSRFEFEHLYLSKDDPWECLTSEYEHAKYVKTLDQIVALCGQRRTALEIGSGIGVFSEMLAGVFDTVVGVDISRTAILRARARVRASNIKFFRRDLRDLSLQKRFDAIICAEMLYYLSDSDAEIVSARLRAHLAETGVVFVITGAPIEMDNWEELLRREFQLVAKTEVPDSHRPYKILAFGPRMEMGLAKPPGPSNVVTQ